MMEAHWARVAIEKKRLKVSRFADLNDPFELFALNRHSQPARKASRRFPWPHSRCQRSWHAQGTLSAFKAVREEALAFTWRSGKSRHASRTGSPERRDRLHW